MKISSIITVTIFALMIFTLLPITTNSSPIMSKYVIEGERLNNIEIISITVDYESRMAIDFFDNGELVELVALRNSGSFTEITTPKTFLFINDTIQSLYPTQSLNLLKYDSVLIREIVDYQDNLPNNSIFMQYFNKEGVTLTNTETLTLTKEKTEYHSNFTLFWTTLIIVTFIGFIIVKSIDWTINTPKPIEKARPCKGCGSISNQDSDYCMSCGVSIK